MSRRDQERPPPYVAFLYEMTIAFFEAARQVLDPVLQAIGGYDDLGRLDDGRPGTADAVVRKFGALPSGAHARHLGACLTATTNLGLAYLHSFRLLSFLVQGKDALPDNATRPNLVKLYDALPSALRAELSLISKQVGSHDLEMEMSAGPFPADSRDDDGDRTKDFRSQLAYRDHFPDCACEQGSVSDHSPGPVEDGEVLIRTIFQDDVVDPDGRPKPSFFRRDPTSRGFSVDRMRIVDPQSLVANKKADRRYTGYLGFIATRGGQVRALRSDDGTRLFCLYDSATADNEAHADICQNVHLGPGTDDRKNRMMEFAWKLRHAFGLLLPQPPAQSS